MVHYDIKSAQPGMAPSNPLSPSLNPNIAAIGSPDAAIDVCDANYVAVLLTA
jgi:hypothetical protein